MICNVGDDLEQEGGGLIGAYKKRLGCLCDFAFSNNQGVSGYFSLVNNRIIHVSTQALIPI